MSEKGQPFKGPAGKPTEHTAPVGKPSATASSGSAKPPTTPPPKPAMPSTESVSPPPQKSALPPSPQSTPEAVLHTTPEELVALLDVDAPTSLTHFVFSKASLAKLEGVHPDLRRLASLALKKYSKVDFGVVDGVRSAADQLKAYNAGKSKIKSGGRHQTGHAIDVIAVDPKTHKRTYNTATGLYDRIHEAFKAASKELKIPFRWGGTFSFGDYGHFELPKDIYSGN